MGTKRELRKYAPELLHASQIALSYLFRQDRCELDEDESERQEVMAVLRDAIDAADPPEVDESEISVRLTMTHISWDALQEILLDSAQDNEDDRITHRVVLEGVRETKQRVYLTLPINHLVLRRLVYMLKHKAPPLQASAFKRMAKQIEHEGLTQNPMEIIAKMGL